jgi:DNA-binding PadR family transcriptional regulator
MPSIGSLELTVLITVAKLGDDAFGLAVRRAVSEQTQHDYSVGAIYTTLQRLEDKRLLASRETDPLPVRGGRSRRLFRITAAGRRAMEDARLRTTALWEGLNPTPLSRST